MLRACFAVVLSLTLAAPAQARLIRFDSPPLAPETPTAAELQNDGSSGPIAIGYQDVDGADFNPFSINILGTSYDSFYINENGNVSFGSAYGGTPGNTDGAGGTDFLNNGVVTFAPFFADADINATGVTPTGPSTSSSISNLSVPSQSGFADDKGKLIQWSVGYNGQSSGIFNLFQMAIIDRSQSSAVGDFDLLFYHGSFDFQDLDPTRENIGMNWETGAADDLDGVIDGLGATSALVGFGLGDGRGFLLPGSGTPGAFLDDGAACTPTSTNLLCTDITFEFRGNQVFYNGQLIDLATATVPEPGSWALMLLGLAGLILSRRTQRRAQ